MHRLLTQLKERRIWRVLIAYPSVVFVLLQAVEFFINNYELDARYLTASLVAAIVLFPAAVVWNWRHGEVGEQAFSGVEVGSYAVFGVLAVVAVGWYWRSAPEDMRVAAHDLAPARSVAVMPFVNAGGDAEAQYLCDGIAESLVNWLATVPDIKVVSKGASFRLRDSMHDTAKLANELDVDSVVTGELELVGDKVVVSARMVDVRDDSQIWGARLVQPSEDVIYLERSIVAAIKDSLSLRISGTVESALAGSAGSTCPPRRKRCPSSGPPSVNRRSRAVPAWPSGWIPGLPSHMRISQMRSRKSSCMGCWKAKSCWARHAMPPIRR